MNKTILLTVILVLGVCAGCQAAEPRSPLNTPSATAAASAEILSAIPATLSSDPAAATGWIRPTTTIISPIATQAASPTSAPAAASEGCIAFYSDRDGNPEIYTINSDGSGLMRLTDNPAFDDSPAISPDGKQILFLTARHDPDPHFPDLKYEIYLMDIDGSSLRRLTDTDAAEDHPAWSPDGSKILFDADYDGDGFYEIYTLNLDGSGLTRLTTGESNDQFADWSLDGAQIAFSSDRSGSWDIFVMNADGSNPQTLTSGPDWELFPAWSPDGNQIAFNGLAPRSRNTDVFVMDASGRNLRQLTREPGFDENPVWSPGGSQIAFQTARDGRFEIYVMNADGSQPHPLAPHPAGELWPSWGVAAPAARTSALLHLAPGSRELGMRETFQAALGDLGADFYLDVFVTNMDRFNEVWLY